MMTFTEPVAQAPERASSPSKPFARMSSLLSVSLDKLLNYKLLVPLWVRVVVDNFCLEAKVGLSRQSADTIPVRLPMIVRISQACGAHDLDFELHRLCITGFLHRLSLGQQHRLAPHRAEPETRGRRRGGTAERSCRADL